MNIKEQWLEKIEQINSLPDLYKIKNTLFNKTNGVVFLELQKFQALSIEEKKLSQNALNEMKNAIENAIKAKEKQLSKKNIELVDHTYLPPSEALKPHYLTQAIDLFHQIFKSLNFSYEEGPDVENTYYNFDALNIQESHPARDNQDTFYLENNLLLRTQTTAVQIRTLEKQIHKEQTRTYSIGTVYRNDTHDSTHLSVFNQVECIVVEENVSLAHLKGLIEYIAMHFFEQKVFIEFRPSFFAFTEPSYEIFIYAKKENEKLIMDQNGECIEIGGCGIIHPTILEKFNKKGKIGFAFGLGLERWVMLKHNLTTLKSLYTLK